MPEFYRYPLLSEYGPSMINASGDNPEAGLSLMLSVSDMDDVIDSDIYYVDSGTRSAIVDIYSQDTVSAVANLPGSPGLGAYDQVVQIFSKGANPARVTLNTQAVTTLLVRRGGKTADEANQPTDNKGNTFSASAAPVDMADWPGYGSSEHVLICGVGGSNHQIDSFVTSNDEHTVFVTELLRVSRVAQTTLVNNANAGAPNPVSATAVTVAGPAALILTWWGTGNPNNGNHWAHIDDDAGWVYLGGWFFDDPQGYVQGHTWIKMVGVAGTYGATVRTSITQGTQLRLTALTANFATTSLTQSDDTVTATSTVTGGATANATITVNQTVDTVTSTVTHPVSASVTLSQSSDTVTSTVTHPVSGSVMLNQAADTVASSVTHPVSASVSLNQAADTISAAVTHPVSASVSLNQAADTVTSTVTHPVSASVSLNQAADTISVVVGQASNATIIVNQSADTVTSTVTHPVSVSVALNQSADTVTSTVEHPVNLSFVQTQNSDTVTSTVTHPVSASIALNQSTDTIAVTVTHPVSASVALSQSSDTIAATVTHPVSASVALPQSADSILVTVATQAVSTAQVVFTQSSDTVSSSVTHPVSASVVKTQNADTVTSVASHPVLASLTLVQQSDIIIADIDLITRAQIAITQQTDTVSAQANAIASAQVVFTQSADTVTSFIGEQEPRSAIIVVSQEEDFVGVTVGHPTLGSSSSGFVANTASATVYAPGQARTNFTLIPVRQFAGNSTSVVNHATADIQPTSGGTSVSPDKVTVTINTEIL